MTDTQRQKAYSLLEQGFSTAEITKRTGLKPTSVAALRAHLTMKNRPQHFVVTGTFVVEASSREDAIAATRRARVAGTRILSEDVTVSRASNAQVASVTD
mgnify:FL=1